MNLMQSGAFLVYFLSVLSCGAGVYYFIDRENKLFLNKYLFLAEVCLIGSIFLTGQLFALSLIGLYRAPYLWGTVILNYAFFLKKNIRDSFLGKIAGKIRLDLPALLFMVFVAVFIFRNYFPLFDVDSIATYLFTQKLWLSAGTSLIGDGTFDVRLFVPQFNAIPYSLGLCLFGQETLFPQLTNVLWRLIALFLIFGYTSYRFNRYLGLSAFLFVLLNDHFFYSGANKWVIQNGALIAVFFASAYSFWEARPRNSQTRFLLAVIFSMQIAINKYQMLAAAVLLFLIGLYVQEDPLKKIKGLFYERGSRVFLLVFFLMSLLWLIKNAIITGDPLFPIFAGRLNIFNWTPEQELYVMKYAGLFLSPMKFLKFMNFLFIWPGVSAAKYLILTVSFLPFVLAILAKRSRLDKGVVLEWSFWLAISISAIFSVCLVSWIDPRVYRYPIAVLSFATVFSMYQILTRCFNLKYKVALYGLVIILPLAGRANEGLRVISQQGGHFGIPTFKENIETVLGKVNMDYIIDKYHPEIRAMQEFASRNREKMSRAAWDFNSLGLNFPAFFLPVRPVNSLFLNALIRWDSFESKKLIIKDLKARGIDWMVCLKEGKPVFVDIEDYASEAAQYDRHPKKVFLDYGFPAELSSIQ